MNLSRDTARTDLASTEAFGAGGPAHCVLSPGQVMAWQDITNAGAYHIIEPLETP